MFGFRNTLLVGTIAAIQMTPAIGATAAPVRGHTKPFKNCSACPEMIRIPGGRFLLGSSVADPDSDNLERPQQRVQIKAFAIGRYPVTKGEYAVFVAATRRPTEKGCSWTIRTKGDPDPLASWEDTSFPQTARDPIVCITWEDVNAYVNWLRRKTGKPYRLPSEAEWEYAARAGTTTRFPWGETASHEFANYGAEQFGPLKLGRDRWLHTSPVGSFPQNRFGLFDMNGNVLQLVADCFSSDYRNLPLDGSPYLESESIAAGPIKEVYGRSSCSLHMLRGGDWGDPGRMVRSSFRNFGPAPTALRSTGVGFRVALTLAK